MTMERNVVILGKVGSGKKTLGNHIVGKDIFRRGSSVGTADVGACCKERKRGDILYHILTVDTEGFETAYKSPLPPIRENFETIHLIIFVIANGRYTDESHKSLIQTIESIRPERAKPFSALVITHCEGITDVERKGIVAEFKTDHRSSQVAAFFEKGIHTVGFPDLSRLAPNLRAVYQSGIEENEETIRKLVDECDQPLTTANLQQSRQRSHKQPGQHRKCCNIL